MYRYLRCARRYAGCRVTGRMGLEAGSLIVLGNHHQHIHHPCPHHALRVRAYLRLLRERGAWSNATPAQIYDETTPQYVLFILILKT